MSFRSLFLVFVLAFTAVASARVTSVVCSTQVVGELPEVNAGFEFVFKDEVFASVEKQFSKQVDVAHALATKNELAVVLRQKFEEFKAEVEKDCQVGQFKIGRFKLAHFDPLFDVVVEVRLQKTGVVWSAAQVALFSHAAISGALRNCVVSVIDESTFADRHGGKMFLGTAAVMAYFWKTQNYPAVAVRAYDWVFQDRPIKGPAFDKMAFEKGFKANNDFPQAMKSLPLVFLDELESGCLECQTGYLCTFKFKEKGDVEQNFSWSGASAVESTKQAFLCVRLTTLVDILRAAAQKICRSDDGGYSEFEKQRNTWTIRCCGGEDDESYSPWFLGNNEGLSVTTLAGACLTYKTICTLFCNTGPFYLVVIDDLGPNYSKDASWMRRKRVTSRYLGNDASILHPLICDVPRLGLGRCIHQPLTSMGVLLWLFGAGGFFAGSYNDIAYNVFSVEGLQIK
jgi:hypothetical protein